MSRGLGDVYKRQVLSRPPKEDQELISSAIKKALSCIDEIVEGDFSRAMSILNEKNDPRK